MKQTGVLGQSTNKGGFDRGLADRVNKETAAKNKQKKLKEKKKKTEPKQEEKQPDKTANLEKIVIDIDNVKEHLPKLQENKEYVLKNCGVYYINKEIRIPETSKLTIEAGTILNFVKYIGIINQGTLEIKGTEQQKTIITAQNQKEGWNHIENFGYLLVEYAKISHGKSEVGGAIYNLNKADIIDSEFTDNQAQHGGAIYTYNGTVNIKGTNTFKNNHAKSCGGAIYTYNGTVNIKGTNTFKNNKATKRGGAIYNSHNAELNIKGKNEFKNNQAKDGGAISWKGIKPNIDPKTIYKNNTPNNVSEDV